jgi:hypothetical protein
MYLYVNIKLYKHNVDKMVVENTCFKLDGNRNMKSLRNSIYWRLWEIE